MPSAAIIDLEAARLRLRKPAAAPACAFWYAVPVWAMVAVPMAMLPVAPGHTIG